MKKTICDCCGVDEGCKEFQVPCHVAEKGEHGYVDNRRELVSGRYETYDLCSRCYNRVHTAAFAEIQRLEAGGGGAQ